MYFCIELELTRVSISELSSREKVKPTLLYSFCMCWREREGEKGEGKGEREELEREG